MYDGFGNLTQRTQGSLIQYFAYDDENRLLRSWGDGPQGRYEACYYYDALGRRIRKRVHYLAENKEITTRFRWQGLRLIQETAEGTTRSYVYDPDEEWTPLARITQRGEQRQTEWFHSDLNGAPLELTDRAGNIVWCGRYSAWGKLHPQPYTEEEEGVLPRQPLRYAGQYADEETGLHYNTFRYYDPEVGRFTTQDPIGLLGGLNLYQYGPNPLLWIDPLGWECEITAHSNQPSPRPAGKESHHIIQDAWAKSKIPGYSRSKAPAILLDKKTHSIITTLQNGRRNARLAEGLSKWSTTIRDEFNHAYRDLKAAGVDEKTIRKAISKSYRYFEELGVF